MRLPAPLYVQIFVKRFPLGVTPNLPVRIAESLMGTCPTHTY
jgi:hypothetical protein